MEYKNGKTYILCLGTFACYLGKQIEKNIDNDIKVWMLDGNEHKNGFFSSCIRHCDIKDSFLLLAAVGGNTSSKLANFISAELENWNLKYSSIIILPALMEGSTNIARALWESQRLVSVSERIFFIENSYPSTDNIGTIKQGIEALEAKVYTMVKMALIKMDKHSEMINILDEYRNRCMNRENILFSIGCMYEEGRTIQKDIGKAIAYYQKAANFGHATAWLRIGDLYRERKDDCNAFNCYINAAYKGEAEAACKLGELYTNGIGVEKDYAMALHWYIKAAKQGNAEGILQFACCLLDGRGVEKNRLLGLKNLRIAADTGYKPARDELIKRLREDRSRKTGLKLHQKLTIWVIESGFSARMYATKIGFPFNKFQQILEGKMDADIHLLKAIIKSYPNADLKYLLEE